MAINYGFFNSKDNDRLYNADDMSNYFEGLVGDGVYSNVGQACVVKTNGDLTITVGTGRAIISNKWVKIDTPQTLRLYPHASLSRYVAICLQLSLRRRDIRLTTISGTASTTPTLPTITNTDEIKYLKLAHVFLSANATSISQSNITDTRSDKRCCGWVTGLVTQVDTSDLFLQFQTAYEKKLEEINNWQNQLDSEGLDGLWADISEIKNAYKISTHICGKIETFNGNKTVSIGFQPRVLKLYGVNGELGALYYDGVILKNSYSYTTDSYGGGFSLNDVSSTEFTLNGMYSGDIYWEAFY